MSKLSLCLGFFDSVHIGHRALLSLSANYAKEHGLTPAVYTFRSDMSAFFGGSQLYDFEVRSELLSEYATVIADDFDQTIASKSGEEFIRGLINRFDIGAFFCGYDYTFGRGGACNSGDLKRIASAHGIDCFVMPKKSFSGEKVSTSRIKALLNGGKVSEANELLGSEYRIVGEVVHGRGVGGTIGIPTANLDYSGFLPKEGVYKTLVTVDGEQYRAVTNVGSKPTFGISSETIESMLIGYVGDLYGKKITVKFIKYLRGIHKFDSGEELREQINKDIKETLC